MWSILDDPDTDEEPPEVEAHQIIDADGSLSHIVDKLGVDDQHYHVLASIGCQGGGKSTMLNVIFNTTFPTMFSVKGYHQTTQGVWISKDCRKPIVVLDMEGADSHERFLRGDLTGQFERQVGLLALSVADTILVTLPCVRVTRRQAGCIFTTWVQCLLQLD
eukprot:Blabericola_migrator_1__8976@NODE_4776_length_983_cov_15213_173581_g2977_i0_p1_GENE_NODE_4776_length_983_cov_15213_173581_g2977_i0NODE_4776_length_983_cov_15213_173581_g2977_i0_p1_ORF_typecomplete_len162_score15_15RHD3/PF05879_12/2_2e26GBP/PF02263_19/5_9e07MMR_HSR1/PF01926_23/0_00091AIG1/PF04548_16/0_0041FAD_binding_3/PF01494_19/0_06Torsin/PF06309_11/0_11ABC_tran/PF00005_27/0_21_NODE_4776_length_983_cov_15213_173581_g2977_i0113598